MISKEQYRQEVNALLKDKVEKFIHKVEKRKVINTFVLLFEFVVFLTSTILIITGVIKQYHPTINIIIPATFILFVLSAIIVIRKHQKLYKDFKTICIYDILEVLLQDYSYNYTDTEYIAPYLFEESPYSSCFNHPEFSGSYKYYGEDLINIRLSKDDPNSLTLSMSDLRVDSKNNSDGEDLTVYSGCFGYIELPFNFDFYLGVNTNIKRDNVKKFELEDVGFNENFSVYSDNEISALLVFTPSFMEKLKNFKKEVLNLSFALVKNRIYISLPTSSIFNIKKVDKNFNDHLFDEIYDDVCTILSIVEEIKSNKKIKRITEDNK